MGPPIKYVLELFPLFACSAQALVRDRSVVVKDWQQKGCVEDVCLVPRASDSCASHGGDGICAIRLGS